MAEPQAQSHSTQSTETKKKITVIEETISSSDSLLAAHYRPSISSKNVIIQRTAVGLLGSSSQGGGSRSSFTRDSSLHYAQTGVSPGAFALDTSRNVSTVKQSRVQEKKDMQDLNERLANYIEKVRFLEAQNKKLSDELEKLKSKWGKETTLVKAMYQAELDEARRLLDDAVREKARMEVRVASIEELLTDLQRRLDDAVKSAADSKEKLAIQIQQLADKDGEISLLRRRLESFETDHDKERRQVKLLQDSLNAARADLDNETLLHIDAENKRQTLEEELEFLKALHEQEMKELAALAYRDTTSENREYWKTEMGQALREIQQVYDDKVDGMRGELETFYNMKVQESRTGATRQVMESVHAKDDNKRLRTQLTSLRDKLSDLESRNGQLSRELEELRKEKEKRERELEDENSELKGEVVQLRAEMESILKELQHIMDTKLGLELEIAAYRKLLEGEENRVGLRQIVDQLSEEYSFRQTENTSGDSSMKVNQIVKGEMSAKTTFQRSAKGPIAIFEVSADGKFIVLENTGRKDEDLSEWKLKRHIDGKDAVEFSLPKALSLKPADKIKVFSKGNKPSDAAAGDIEVSIESFGSGANIITKLFNPAGEDRASHVQNTSYAS